MSEFVGLGITAATANISSLIGLFTTPIRMIGPIIPGIVIEEDHQDALTITDHPVERGANITDHAFKQPARLDIQCQWSNTQASLFDFSESYINTIYLQLRNLQIARSIITVVTGKRVYNNMLIESIGTRTDKETAYCLPVQLSLREIIIVQTTITSVPPADAQANPAQTGAPVIGGQSALQGTGSGSQSGLFAGLTAAGVEAPVAAIINAIPAP